MNAIVLSVPCCTQVYKLHQLQVSQKGIVDGAVDECTKNGHTDIYTYKIEEQKATQITNDVYDDLNPQLVSFPNRTGIIYSSNRPAVDAPSNDTVQPSRYRFNIFLVDILNNSAAKQITQLTNLKFGNATMPSNTIPTILLLLPMKMG